MVRHAQSFLGSCKKTVTTVAMECYTYFLSIIIITGTLSGPISSKGCKLQATHPRVDNVFDQKGVA